MIQDLVTAYKYGLKQLYYFNTFDGAGELKEEEDYTDDYWKREVEEDEDDCDSCAI